MEEGSVSARGIHISPVSVLQGPAGVYRDLNDVRATLGAPYYLVNRNLDYPIFTPVKFSVQRVAIWQCMASALRESTPDPLQTSSATGSPRLCARAFATGRSKR